MTRPKANHWRLALALMSAGLLLQSCQTSTEPEISLEDLTGKLNIQLTSLTGGGSAASSSFNAVPIAADLTTEPSVSEITPLFPGTPGVFDWPVIQELPIVASWQGSSEIELGWPSLDPDLWPEVISGPANDDGSPAYHMGTAWIVYFDGGGWVAEAVEWLRAPHERTGTVFPTEHITGHVDRDYPVAFFIAGPSRHSPDDPEFRRRVPPVWFHYNDFSPWVWDNPAGGPPSPPAPTPVLEQVNVYITGMSTQLAGGTSINFQKEIGAVDLLAIRGKPIQVVDTEVPRGTFDHIDFTVDASRSNVIYGGEQRALVIDNNSVRVNGPFIVGPVALTTVTLQFDPDASLTQNPDGTWRLAPVVQIVVTTQ